MSTTGSDFNDRRAAIISVVSDHDSDVPDRSVEYDWALLLDDGRAAPSEIVQIVRATYSDEFERITWIRRHHPGARLAIEQLVFEAPAPFQGKRVHITGIVATFPTVAACSVYKLTFGR